MMTIATIDDDVKEWLEKELKHVRQMNPGSTIYFSANCRYEASRFRLDPDLDLRRRRMAFSGRTGLYAGCLWSWDNIETWAIIEIYDPKHHLPDQ